MPARQNADRRIRAIRAGAASATAVTIAGASHTLAGGTAPPAWLMLAVIILAWPLALTLVSRRASTVRTAAVVAVAQVLLHTAFAMVGTGSPEGLGHHTHAIVELSAVTGTAAVHPSMAVGHVLAAIVTTAAVRHGERLLAVVAAGVRAILPTVPVPLPAPSSVPATVTAYAAPHSSPVFLTGLSRRGPPS